ncbi:uncharacterized protein LOC126893541 [Daktulosphaira vitifoliae]|uniref:uncharacterized protein LOC126893541 n=1 Tax=Daktulosphaira vitifoliae TaxID=58002 RepID=UPI0021AAEAE4|nr:uncharacterized protein LOC126893541 [Daktulosphaira vitifoliae]
MTVKTLQCTSFFFFLLVITSNINALSWQEVVNRLENMLHFIDFSDDTQYQLAKNMKYIHDSADFLKSELVDEYIIKGLKASEEGVYTFCAPRNTVNKLTKFALNNYTHLSKDNKTIFCNFLKKKDVNNDGIIDLNEFISFNNDWSSKYFKDYKIDESPKFKNIK